MSTDAQTNAQELNDYEARIEAKRERYEARAASAAAASNAAHQQARRIGDAIPLGQPILVDHYSANRHRRDIGRIDAAMRKSCELQDKAEHYAQKAASVGTGGISSDDPEAIKKLRSELENCQASQERMKAANAAIRKHKTPEAQTAALMAQGFTEAQAAECIKPDFCGRVGFPAYALQNNNANMRRIEQRIKDLERMQSRQAVELECNGYTYKECTEENRVMFLFPSKPAEEIRKILKRHAFKFSPSRNGAWVRQMTASGLWAGKQVRQELAALEPKAE